MNIKLIPRIMSILFIIFLSIFSFDVFGEGYGFWESILAFLIHNIPVFILIILLFIAWKKDIVGMITFLIGGLLYLFIILIDTKKFEWYILIIIIPLFTISFLYYLNYKKYKKNLNIKRI